MFTMNCIDLSVSATLMARGHERRTWFYFGALLPPHRAKHGTEMNVACTALSHPPSL